jgi:hypothetical protein
MQKSLVIMFVSCFLVCSFSVAEPNEPNNIEAKVEELRSLMGELPVMRQGLETKEYSGTMKDILAKRIVDVNQVRTHSIAVKTMAKEVATMSGLDSKKAEAIKTVIERARRKSIDIKGQAIYYGDSEPPKMDDPNYISEVEQMKHNSEFRYAMVDLASDPNVMPDPNDPNYFEIAEQLLDLQAFIEEICNPS